MTTATRENVSSWTMMNSARLLIRSSTLLALLVASSAAIALPPGNSHWVGTWATASYANQNGGASPIGASDETLREIVHVSIGGSSLRVVLTNEYGTAPLTIGGASVALPTTSGSVRPESVHPLQFGGQAAITIPTGAIAVSDPVSLNVAPLSDLAVSLFVPAQTIATLSEHPNAVQTNYRIAGNAVAQTNLSGATVYPRWSFVKDVQVLAPANAGAIVAYGDSITDGAYVTRDSNMRWPDELARRLQADKHDRDLAVLNEGIGGNRVLHDGTGPNALARLGRDGLELPGARYIILLEAINDIGHAYQPKNPYDVVTAQDLIQGYQQIIDRAHEHGIKVIGATLTPYMGAGYSSPAGEQVRVAVNQWIRQPGHFDGIIDFEAATRDPNNPTMYLPSVEHGDHLHPDDAGYKVMGDAIDLSLFRQ